MCKTENKSSFFPLFMVVFPSGLVQGYGCGNPY